MIALQNVAFSYDKSQKLISNLDLEIKPGHIYGLLGKNGVGKTTLLKLIHGVLFNAHGSIRLDEKNVNSRTVDHLNQVFYLPEEYDLPAISINDYVKANHSFYPNFNLDQFRQIIDTFQLEGSRSFGKYSYGQKKKFLLAFGLACNTKYLLLDEPTNGLDIPSKAQLRKIIASNISENQAILISTHQVRDLSNLIDAVIVIDNGNIIFQKDIFQISEKLTFKRDFIEDKGDDVIYSEMIPGGFLSIKSNSNQSGEEVDLEGLFNAIVTNPKQINQLF